MSELSRLRESEGQAACPDDVARLKGLEPLTHCLEGSCSIHLSYRRIMERVMGIEPTRPAWKAGILPLNYTRMDGRIRKCQLAYDSTNHWPCQ